MHGRVLIVEDEVDLAATLEYSLTREGYQVTVAHTGRRRWPRHWPIPAPTSSCWT
jgi:DNA-binding response OmpR family regulator